MTPPRILQPGHPDRPTSVEEAIEPGYRALVQQAMRRGIDQQEAAMAIEILAMAHLDTLRANDATELAINHARRMAGMSERDADEMALEEQRRMLADIPSPPSSWPWLAAGAAFATAAVIAVRMLG